MTPLFVNISFSFPARMLFWGGPLSPLLSISCSVCVSAAELHVDLELHVLNILLKDISFPKTLEYSPSRCYVSYLFHRGCGLSSPGAELLLRSTNNVVMVMAACLHELQRKSQMIN